MNEKINTHCAKLSLPSPIGSYQSNDCVFLLKDVSNQVIEKTNEERQALFKQNIHYSEVLPKEYYPSDSYLELFHRLLTQQASSIAQLVCVLAERILEKRGKNVVLVSLARAGTPIGVLVKRYLLWRYQLDLPHYSISIIKDKTIDENALCYILNKHQTDNLQFIDGWTGKGAIFNNLQKFIGSFNQTFRTNILSSLAVLADPAYCSDLYATREDVLIPSACLNATVSGLVSRTFLRNDLIGEFDFHGAKYYKEWISIDLSNVYVDTISNCFPKTDYVAKKYDENLYHLGASFVMNIAKQFAITNLTDIKPGIGETTRVLLRRIPWKILIRDENDPALEHILLLAKDRQVSVETYLDMPYLCCGLVKS